MKKIFLALFTCLLSCASFAQGETGKFNGSINSGKLTLNDIAITNDWKITSLVKSIGAAERIKDGYNKTHTYDNYGIVLFEKQTGGASTDTLSEIQFYFSDMERNSVTPEGYYSGNFKVENLKISKELTARQVRDKLKGYTESESYLPHNYRFANKGLYIYFQFDDEDSRLQKMSIGRDMR
jgi:hypothetical protein